LSEITDVDRGLPDLRKNPRKLNAFPKIDRESYKPKPSDDILELPQRKQTPIEKRRGIIPPRRGIVITNKEIENPIDDQWSKMSIGNMFMITLPEKSPVETTKEIIPKRISDENRGIEKENLQEQRIIKKPKPKPKPPVRHSGTILKDGKGVPDKKPAPKWDKQSIESESLRLQTYETFRMSGLSSESRRLAKTSIAMRLNIKDKEELIKCRVADFVRVTNILRTNRKKLEQFFREYNKFFNNYSNIREFYTEMENLGPKEFYKVIWEKAKNELIVGGGSTLSTYGAPRFVKVLWPPKIIQMAFGSDCRDKRHMADIMKDIKN